MRTTLTLDDDVAAALQRLRKSHKASLKALVNQALREGLKQLCARPRPFRTEAVPLGPLRIRSIDNVAEAISVAEAHGCLDEPPQ